MNKTQGFAILTLGSLVVFMIAVTWYLVYFQNGSMSMSGLMTQMMGSQYSGSMATGMPAYIWGVFAVIIATLVVGVGGMGYYLTLPEIRNTDGNSSKQETSVRQRASRAESWSTILRTASLEEGRVLGVLAEHGGVHLQKLIVKESGLSRLKTHRILSRFAGRGIVTVSKSGNTNEIRLADWLKYGSSVPGQDQKMVQKAGDSP